MSSAAVERVSLPARARAVSTLARLDYSDAFLVDVGVELGPRQWASTMLQEAPIAMRLQLISGWSALGLRLGGPWAADRVLGWKVVQSTPEFVLLQANSWVGLGAELLFYRRRGGVLFATLMRHDNRVAGAVWRLITPTHQAVVGSLLRHAARRAVAGSGGRFT
jgi:hypothetical protein